MKHKLLVVYTLCFLLIGVFFLIGCNRDKGSSNDCSENQTFVLEKGIAHFSFEYPSCFKTGIIEVREDLDYTSIVLEGPSIEQSSENDGLTLIYVFILRVTEDLPDAEFALEHFIDFSNRTSLEDFYIVEQSLISVNGIEGYQLIYTWDSSVYESSDESEIKPKPTISRKVYYDYDGMIWEFTISCDPDVYEKTNIIFNYLLNTFKIIE